MEIDSYNPLLDSDEKKPLLRKDKVSCLMNLFIKHGTVFNHQDFRREMFAANKLINAYPDFDFFFTLPDLTNKFNSLLGLMSARNKVELAKKYKDFVIEKKRKSLY